MEKRRYFSSLSNEIFQVASTIVWLKLFQEICHSGSRQFVEFIRKDLPRFGCNVTSNTKTSTERTSNASSASCWNSQRQDSKIKSMYSGPNFWRYSIVGRHFISASDCFSLNLSRRIGVDRKGARKGYLYLFRSSNAFLCIFLP